MSPSPRAVTRRASHGCKPPPPDSAQYASARELVQVVADARDLAGALALDGQCRRGPRSRQRQRLSRRVEEPLRPSPPAPPLGTCCKAQETVVEGEALLIPSPLPRSSPSPLSWCAGAPTRAFTGSSDGTRPPGANNPPAGAFPATVAAPWRDTKVLKPAYPMRYIGAWPGRDRAGVRQAHSEPFRSAFGGAGRPRLGPSAGGAALRGRERTCQSECHAATRPRPSG